MSRPGLRARLRFARKKIRRVQMQCRDLGLENRRLRQAVADLEEENRRLEAYAAEILEDC